MAKNRQCGADETECPAGCCPEANWFCCPDNMYCAATAADCPFVAKKAQLMKMAKNRQCGADETECPAGCCPEANWFCCPDNMYCAATAADCPFVAKKAQLMKMAKNRQCGLKSTRQPINCHHCLFQWWCRNVPSIQKNVTKVVRSLCMMCASPIVELIRDSKFYLSSHLFKTVASQD